MGGSCRIAVPIALAAFISGCAHQAATFRLTAPGNSATLIPPGTKDATVARANLPIPQIPRKTVCSPSPHGILIQKNRVIVNSEAMNATAATELFSWTTQLEKEGCIPLNNAFQLAESIIDALPLSVAKRRELLQGRTDLKSINSLNVVSPVMRPGGSGRPSAEVTSVSQGETPASIDIDVKSHPSVIGYEVDWYGIQPQNTGPGYRIVPRNAEIHVGGNTERPAAPSTSRFQFGPDARWCELYMMTKVSANDFDFVVLSARTSAELRSYIAEFQHDATAFLRTADPSSYTLLPHGTSINAYVRVSVNGVSVDLPRGNTLRQAIGQSADPRAISSQLKVRKLHHGKLFPVEWDRTTDQILSLPLEGGEDISW